MPAGPPATARRPLPPPPSAGRLTTGLSEMRALVGEEGHKQDEERERSIQKKQRAYD